DPSTGLLVFEAWLETQAHREDETGALARFVVADVEKYCWPGYGRVYKELSTSRRREDWYAPEYVRHLARVHGVEINHAIDVVGRVHEEWLTYRSYFFSFEGLFEDQ
nr:hypothetical protein [Actinomycetota bacterium]